MATMNMGYYYEEGKRVGYDIIVPNCLYLSNVARKDKARIIRELERNGHSSYDIECKRVENL